MQITYPIKALNNAPGIVQVGIDALKIPKATSNPQYGENTLTICHSPCSTAFAPLSKSYYVAPASKHGDKKTPAINVTKKTASFVCKYFMNVIAQVINRHLNLKNSYFQIILALVCNTNCFAGTEFAFTPRSKIEAQIGSGELNRIEVKGSDIMEVVGDEAKYSLYWSSDWRNLFIKPKVPTGETFELSLIFFGGLAQDIRFTAGDTTAKTITINKDNENHNSDIPRHIHKHDFRPLSDYRLQQEVTAMMRAMFEAQPRAEGYSGKYYVTDTKRLLKITPELQIRQIKAYRYKDLSGAVLIVKNSTKTPVILQEEFFRGLFKSTLAINLKTLSVAPKAKTTVFIVTKGGVNAE